MSQFGMQMPGGRQQRGATPDVYTAMMFLSVVAMITAVALLWMAGSKVAPNGNPLEVQETGKGRIQLPD